MKLRNPNLASKYCVVVVLVMMLFVPLVLAQNIAPSGSAPPGNKPVAFEVVSIRPSKRGSRWMIGWMTTPNGYHVIGQSMRSTIMIAYFPQGTAFWSKDRLIGAPQWIDDLYDINAKVSESDLDEWQKQGTSLDKKTMLQQMLQTMLSDRCHLAVRRMPGGEQPGYALELGKHGLHLTESKPGEVLPDGVSLGEGGVLVPWSRGESVRKRFYGATMAEIARSLSNSRIPVRDQTGLTGRYDLTLSWIDYPDSKMPPGFVSSDDPDPLSHWDFDAIGLHLRPIKIPVDNLKIVYIEKPSAN